MICSALFLHPHRSSGCPCAPHGALQFSNLCVQSNSRVQSHSITQSVCNPPNDWSYATACRRKLCLNATSSG